MASLEEIYDGKTLLLTGTTGFLGKVLLEKLLFSQPMINKIYLLIRGKKGSKLDERFKKEVIESPCFDRLRERYGNKFDEYINQKIKPIQGDMLKERLGLSTTDEKQIIQNVNIIMNCAASIDFNARLDDAININIKGTLKMLDLAKKIKNLNNFTHVSTCYVNCTEKERLIEEKIYNNNSDPEQELKNLQALPLKDLVNQTDQIIGDYPNTYTFTKNLCERILNKRRGDLTLTIFRPAVIINSYQEPYEGWVDSVAAAVALFFFCGLGVIKEIYGNPRIIGDVITVDTVSNYIIVSTAYNANTNKLAVFHSSSSQRNPVSWGQCEEQCKKYWTANKASMSFSKPVVKIDNTKFNVNFNRMRRRLPAVVYNRIALLFGSKQHIKLSQKALKTLDRGYQIEKLFRFFLQNQFIFESSNVEKLTNWMCPADREKFNIDPAKLDMIRALRLSNYGLQKFILKENVEPISVESTNLFKKQASQTYFSDLKWAFKDAGQSVRKQSIVNVKQEIFKSSRVQQAIYKHALSKNEFQHEDSKQFIINKRNSEKAADEIINQMFGTFSMPIVRLQAWILTKFLKSIYEKIIVNETVFENFRKIENQLKIPIIMAPTHKSYLDFIILTYLFFNYKLKIPYVASNEVLLKMTLIPYLLRSSGAFFIKDNEIKKNPLYRSILQQFIIKILSDNNNMEFFLEGSRSRTGKILELDFSILEIIVESILDEHVNDACIVPVTINYEKVLEGDTFPQELLGEQKVEESLLRVVKTYKLLKTNFGRVYVEFAEPIYLKQYIKKQITTTFNPYKDKTHRKQLVNTLGYQIVNKLTDKLVIMSTSIVCTAILMNRKGITEDLLMKNVHWISKEVLARGHKIGGINENSPNIAVRNAVIHLDEISKTKKNVFEVQISAGEEYKKLLMLSYYRNMLTHVFLPQAFVGVALYSFGKQLSQKEGITYERLQDKVQFLASILKKQFVMQINIQDPTKFNQVFEQMLNRNILCKNAEGKIIISPEGEKMILLYCSLLWPLIQCYWVSILYFISMKYSINKIHSVDLEKLKEYIQWYAQSLYEQKIVEYYESCSLQTIKNAIKTFEHMKLIEIRKLKKEERVDILATEESLTELESKLKNYLKNGKLVSSSDLARISISGDNLLNSSKL